MNALLLQVRVAVAPLVESCLPLMAAMVTRTRLSLDHLDASQLATATSVDPVFTVRRRPRFGRLKRPAAPAGRGRWRPLLRGPRVHP